jgi:MoaD family protein
MYVTVHYFAQLRRAADRTEERVEIELGTTVAGLLNLLSDVHGDAVRSLLVGDAGAPRPSLLVFIDEQPADAARSLVDGDEVTILTPMAGG